MLSLRLRFRSSLISVLTIWMLAVPLSSLVRAQVQAINGSLRGRITDQAGAPMPAAKVTILNTDTGFTRTAATPDDGSYVFPNLPLGHYTVTVEKEGFNKQENTGVTLQAGTEGVIDSQMTVGVTTTSVEVSGGASVVEPSRTSIGRTIDYLEVANAPLTSRNPYNFILFQPGVSGHPNAELGIPRTLNTNGLLDRVNYQMDGMVDTESDRFGLRLFPIADVYVREVQTVSNSFAPEFGGTSGDIYNVITNSGTNDFHGQVQYIGRPTDASARPILLAASKPKPDLTLNDTSVNAGGRIIKDKLFVFGAYEHLTRGLPQPSTISGANAAALGLSSDLTATAPSIQHAQFIDARGDWQITGKHQLFVRGNYFRNQYPFNTSVGGLYALDAASDFRDRAYIGGLQLLSSFSASMLNELRISVPIRNERHLANPLTGPGPQVFIPGVAYFGGSTTVGDVFVEKIPSASEGFTLIKGAHTVKVGGGFQEILDNQTGDTYSQYTFPNVASYLAARSGAATRGYSTFAASVGVIGARYNSLFWNTFAQDSWQIRPNVLITYGVRYDKFQSPDGDPNAPFNYSRQFRTPGANWSPRVGIAWSITPKTVLRVNSGTFYEAPPTNLWYNTLSNDGSSRAFIASLGPAAAFAPAFPGVLNVAPGAIARTPDIYSVTPNFKNAYTYNTSFQLSQQLTNDDSVTVGYVNTGARNQGYLHNVNLINPTGVLGDGRPVFARTINADTRLDPQFGNIQLQDVGAIADYNALIVNYRHRLAKGILASASYTWSKSISDAPDLNSYEQSLPIQDTTSRARDRGNSITNRPHSFTLSSYMAPTFQVGNRILRRIVNDNQLNALVTLASGDQQNITTSTLLNGDSTVQSVNRPLFVGRNTVRGPSVYQLDLRYTRTFFTFWEHWKPQFIAEANNIFNHPNITVLNTVVPVSSIGVAQLPSSFAPQSTTLEGRIIQLGFRLDW